jgi:serine/threonine-protein kinase
LHAHTLPAERASMNDQLILDRYRLVERLAVGGSAEVWRARDEQLDRPVAVKRLHPHLLPDAASRQRLVAEARAAARLGHPAIVGIYDVDATGESAAIVMELVDGESLAARIERDGPLPEREAVGITADVSDALFYAHQEGVVHRDVKPGNVLLGTDGRTRLVDFGIAHSLAASTERLTMAGTVIGTLRAMAPEQLVGGPITPRTDLYGLGAVLLEALTGRPPYDATTPVALAEAQRAGAPTLSGMDPALASAVAACLAYDPAERPLHAGALASALRAWLAGDPLPASGLGAAAAVAAGAVDTATMTQVVPVPAVAAAPATGSGPPTAARPNRRSRAWPLGALVALAAVAMAVAIVLGNTRPDAAGDAVPSTPELAASSTPAPTTPTQQEPTPTESAPGWLGGLLESLAEECGPDVAQAEQPTIASMDRKDAREYVEELVKQCSGDDGDG